MTLQNLWQWLSCWINSQSVPVHYDGAMWLVLAVDWEPIHHVAKHLTDSGKGPSCGLFHGHGNKRGWILTWQIKKWKWPWLLLSLHGEHCPGELSGFTGTLFSSTYISHNMNLCCMRQRWASWYISVLNDIAPGRPTSHLNGRGSWPRQRSHVSFNASHCQCRTPFLCLQKCVHVFHIWETV